MEERVRRRRPRRCCLRGRRRSRRGRGRGRRCLSPQHHLQSWPLSLFPSLPSFVLSSSCFSSNRALAPPTSFKQQIFSFLRLPPLRLGGPTPLARSLARSSLPATASRGPHRRSRTFVRSFQATYEGRRGEEEGKGRGCGQEKGRKEGGEGEGERVGRAIEAVGEDLGARPLSSVGDGAEDGR